MLAKAREAASKTNRYAYEEVTEEELELLLGFLSGEFSIRQLQIATGKKSFSAGVWWVLNKIKKAYLEKKIKLA